MKQGDKEMRLALGSDHRGFELKSKIISGLRAAGHTIEDYGPAGQESVDYTDFAVRVAQAVTSGNGDLGILVCGSGIGMSITANKVRGIRAALCCNSELAERARHHNDANVLCLGADFVDEEQAMQIVNSFLSASFDGGRHQRRLDKISKLESCQLDTK
jgi:ribose 5-phosphate isomerase B